LAGALTILSLCVLPLGPVLAAAAVAAHRFGPLALGIGLAMSFTVDVHRTASVPQQWASILLTSRLNSGTMKFSASQRRTGYALKCQSRMGFQGP